MTLTLTADDDGATAVVLERAPLRLIESIADVREGTTVWVRECVELVLGVGVVSGEDVRAVRRGGDGEREFGRRRDSPECASSRPSLESATSARAPKFHPYDVSKANEIRVERARARSSADVAGVARRLGAVVVAPPAPPPPRANASDARDSLSTDADAVVRRAKPALPPKRGKAD